MDRIPISKKTPKRVSKNNKFYLTLTPLSPNMRKAWLHACQSRLIQLKLFMLFGGLLDLPSKMTMRLSGWGLRSGQLSVMRQKSLMLGWTENSQQIAFVWTNCSQTSSMSMSMNSCSETSFIPSWLSWRKMSFLLLQDNWPNQASLSLFNILKAKI